MTLHFQNEGLGFSNMKSQSFAVREFANQSAASTAFLQGDYGEGCSLNFAFCFEGFSAGGEAAIGQLVSGPQTFQLSDSRIGRLRSAQL